MRVFFPDRGSSFFGFFLRPMDFISWFRNSQSASQATHRSKFETTARGSKGEREEGKKEEREEGRK